MSEDRFDLIIVGAGPAGSAAAITAARAGLEVLLIERSDEPGGKNLSGGRLYAHSLAKLIPDYAETAPLERKVTREVISMLTAESCFSIDFSSSKLAGRGNDSFTVLRADLDLWLSEQAEEAEAVLASGVRVDELHTQDGKVCGVVADEDVLEADCVLLCDGVNSLLAQKAGLKKELLPTQVAVGIKEIIELPKGVIEDRFNLEPDQGAARLFVGDCTKGLPGGGFLYTNKETLSLGLVINLEAASHAKEQFCDVAEAFKRHPEIARLIEGGTSLEYGAHLVPEAGLGMTPKLVGDGVLVAGDAAGFVLNTGYTLRGMDLAIESGVLAAKAVIAAKEKGDMSAAGLSGYETLLQDSFVIKDLKTYESAPAFMETPGLYGDYPALVENIFSEMFTVDGSPAQSMRKKIKPHIKKVGLMRLIKDAWKGRAL